MCNPAILVKKNNIFSDFGNGSGELEESYVMSTHGSNSTYVARTQFVRNTDYCIQKLFLDQVPQSLTNLLNGIIEGLLK